ncbi:hypothetical protein [Aeromonas caviae]|uniref:hypothetical protein n=1 Tax=Aeromonas caviae TaxID=648 RepID=UPI00237F53CF|nr:hypothetical protein [Aeromonas caviae]WDV27318.1 hypothetical protein PVK35_16100 [Aeromonas caviae]
MAITRIPRIREFPSDGRFWRIDWFGGVERNPYVPSEPAIQVLLSPLRTPSSLSDTDPASVRAINSQEQTTVLVGTGQLPLLCIGSLWKDGICQSHYAGREETFRDLLVSPGTTRVVTANHRVGGGWLISPRFYRFGVGNGKTRLMAVTWDDDPLGLLIPMTELLRFYYLVSTDLAHTVFSGALKHDMASVISLKRTGTLPGQSKFVIGLRQHFTDDDAWVLARILASKEAWTGATLPHDSMMRHSLNHDPLQLETEFPFSGRTTLQARCKRIQSDDGSWRHLVLSLTRCSAPFPFDDLVIDRDNDNTRAPAGTDLPDAEKKPAFGPGKLRSEEYQGKDLQNRSEPNKQCSTEIIPLPSSRFDAIAGRKAEKPPKSECRYASRLIPVQTAVSGELGTGAGENNGSAVGTGKVVTQHQRRKALPASFETFAAAIEELDRQPEFSARIREPDPLIEFIPLTKPAGKRQWSYLDSDTRTRHRVIVADICYQERWYSLIEFEQRQNGHFTLALLFNQTHVLSSNISIHQLLSGLAIKNGTWANVSMLYPQGIYVISLKHTWPNPTHCSNAISRRVTGLYRDTFHDYE